MCGRISLGVGAEDLEDLVNQAFYQEEEDNNDLDDEQEHEGEQEEQEQQEEGHNEGEEEAAAGEQAGEGSNQNNNKHQAQNKQQQQNKSGNDAGKNKGKGRSTISKSVDWLNAMTRDDYRPRWNVAPQSRSIIIKRNEHLTKHPDTPTSNAPPYVLELSKWGLIPSWTKEPPSKPLQTINCRTDTLQSPGSIWSSMKDKKRCVVPCEGFYEWQNKGKDKIPFFTKMKPDGRIMMFAGLWDEVTYDDFDSVKSFTVITTNTNSQLRFLHNRMPAILSTPEDIKLWLSDKPFNEVVHLLKPFKEMLTCYKVPLEVGSVRNNNPEFIRPVSERKGNIGSMFAKQAITTSPSKPISASTSALTVTSDSGSPFKSKPLPPSSPPSPGATKDKINKQILTKVDMRLNPDDTVPNVSTSTDSPSKKEGKRKAVEVIELSSGEDSDVIPLPASSSTSKSTANSKGKGKVKEVTNGKKLKKEEKSSPKKKKVKKVEVAEDGTPTLGNFFGKGA